jgi:hypothetical protein
MRITEEVVHDDGTERQRFFALTGQHSDGHDLPRCEVPVEKFSAMEWPISEWGSCAVIYPGNGMKDKVRAAVQLLSKEVVGRTIFTHTGWREIGGEWHYLHGGGGIGARGVVADIPVLLKGALTGYQLPPPPDGDELRQAVLASLKLLTLGPAFLTYSLLASTYRAALGGVDYSVHLAGRTGSFKTTVAALSQQHYGKGMDASALPANWSSTANALEVVAFTAKDAVLVIDEFNPTGSPAAVQRMHESAERVFRAQGNRSGRQRLTCTAVLRDAKHPRGLILSTGEDVPRGLSLRARILTLDVALGDVGPPSRLSECQRDAGAGLYAQATSGFVRWLAPQYVELSARLRDEHAAIREG